MKAVAALGGRRREESAPRVTGRRDGPYSQHAGIDGDRIG
jgi:hypothetical protein